MREIIHIGLGSCGVRIGCKFYEQLIQEYQIENNRVCEKPIDGIDIHFSEVADKKFVPRSILQSRDIDQIMANPQSLFFNPNNYNPDMIDCLRKEIEICDSCQGLQLTFNLASQIEDINSIIEEYPKMIKQCFVVFPNAEYFHDQIKSAFNIKYLENMNVIAFDNQALLDYYFKSYKSQLNHSDYNQVIATVMNGITTPIRNGTLTLQKLYSLSCKLNIDTCKLLQDKQSNLQLLNESKPLITVDSTINDRLLQVNLFTRTSTLNISHLYQSLSKSNKWFYNNIINVNYWINQYKQEILISLMKSSHIQYKLKFMQEQTKHIKQGSFSNLYPEEQDFSYLNQLIQICNEILETHQDDNTINQLEQSPLSKSEMPQDIKQDLIRSQDEFELPQRQQQTLRMHSNIQNQ